MCVFTVILSLSLGFKLSLKNWFFLGLRFFFWKIINIWTNVSEKDRKYLYIYQIKAKNV